MDFKEDVSFEKKNPDENSRKDFISAMKFGLNLGVRYGIFAFVDQLVDQIATLNTENTEDAN